MLGAKAQICDRLLEGPVYLRAVILGIKQTHRCSELILLTSMLLALHLSISNSPLTAVAPCE